MVGETGNCKYLTVFYTRHYCISIFLANLLAKTTSPVKLPLWWDSAQFASNNPTGLFMVKFLKQRILVKSSFNHS